MRECRLSWEMLPDPALSEVEVWDALLDVGMSQTALLRHLPRLIRLGLLPDLGGRTEQVCRQLADVDRLRKAVEPSGKRTLLALDVSSSMGMPISGMPISARAASVALALVQLSTEPQASAVGFSTANPHTWRPSPSSSRLDSATSATT